MFPFRFHFRCVLSIVGAKCRQQDMKAMIDCQALYDSENLKRCLLQPDAFGKQPLARSKGDTSTPCVPALPLFPPFTPSLVSLTMVARQTGFSQILTVATAMSYTTATPFLFRNYEVAGSHFDGASDACMWEAAIATASAPGFFSPFVFRTRLLWLLGRLETTHDTLAVGR
jgi:hypothetical protein